MVLKGEHPLPNLPAEVSLPFACLEQALVAARMLPWDGHLAGAAGTKTHFLFQQSPNKGNCELDWGCSPQPKVLPWNPLPSWLPGGCKGADMLGPSSQWSSQELLGSCLLPASAPVCEQAHAVVGRGTGPLRLCHGCWQIAFLLQDPAMVFVPEEEAVISQKWIPVFVYKLCSLLPVSLKTTQDAFHGYAHHQTTTEETIKMEVHPIYMNQVLNPHVWILLDLKVSITSTGVLRWRISRFVPK